MNQVMDGVNDVSTSSVLIRIPKENEIFKAFRDVVDDAYKKSKEIQNLHMFDVQEDKSGIVT
ncbi:hypothetical protein PHMEG_0006036 [Phytophthora megakarya]|uniref:Uncharacterized protein n=1 Tax=Phytophthora megakarya TaxID=4795 RepID=A0A225WQ45_9STRA|nr:hypothetical protein PHMEG_0006036 [Phytophthora megakarya]